MNVDRLSSSGGDAAVNRPQPAGGEPVRRDGPGMQAPRRRDEFTLSPEARALEAATRSLDEAPDVREDRIASIIQRIENGTYRVADSDLAQAMLQHLDGEASRW